jgi:hypothetical protein
MIPAVVGHWRERGIFCDLEMPAVHGRIAAEVLTK